MSYVCMSYMTLSPLECFLMYRHIKAMRMRPPPKKKTRWVIHPAQFWRGNSMTRTKIIDARLSLSDFNFKNMFKVVRLFFVKMTCKSLKFKKIWPNRSQSLITYFVNNATWSALFRFQFFLIENQNCETMRQFSCANC